MKKLVWVLAGVLTIILNPGQVVRAQEVERGLLIVEVQTGSSSSASEEFIELYNQDEEELNLSTYKLEYFSAAATNFTTPSRVISLSGTLYPGGRYLITSSGYLNAQSNTTFAPTLAKVGGHVRLVSAENNQSITHDLVGWGSATMPETDSADAPESGESLQRKGQADGYYQDTDNNNQDFVISNPSPESNNPVPPVPEDPSPTPTDPTPDPVPEIPEAPEEPTPDISMPEEPVLQVLITELLPNPGSPGTDADDEFIELYNPNSRAVDLHDYRLETGKDFSYHFTFGSQTLAPGQYLVMYAKDTNLVLSNSGGRARLIHANGTVLGETSMYDEAKDDMSWVLIGSSWQWTSTATPGQANVASTATLSASDASTKSTKAAAKPKATKAAATKAKTAAAKTTKPKSSTAKAKKSASEQAATTTKPGVGGPLHPGILAAIGLLAVGYAAYEYRSDIANKFRQLRNFRKNRPTTGEPT